MAGIGGGSGSSLSRGGSGDPLAAVWAGMGGGSGSRSGHGGLADLLAGGGRNANLEALPPGTRSQGGGNGALAALLAGAGGGSRSGLFKLYFAIARDSKVKKYTDRSHK